MCAARSCSLKRLTYKLHSPDTDTSFRLKDCFECSQYRTDERARLRTQRDRRLPRPYLHSCAAAPSTRGMRNRATYLSCRISCTCARLATCQRHASGPASRLRAALTGAAGTCSSLRRRAERTIPSLHSEFSLSLPPPPHSHYQHSMRSFAIALVLSAVSLVSAQVSLGLPHLQTSRN